MLDDNGDGTRDDTSEGRRKSDRDDRSTTTVTADARAMMTAGATTTVT